MGHSCIWQSLLRLAYTNKPDFSTKKLLRSYPKRQKFLVVFGIIWRKSDCQMQLCWFPISLFWNVSTEHSYQNFKNFIPSSYKYDGVSPTMHFMQIYVLQFAVADPVGSARGAWHLVVSIYYSTQTYSVTPWYQGKGRALEPILDAPLIVQSWDNLGSAAARPP